MREILFRGKQCDNGEWVEGGYKHEKVGEYFVAVFIIEHLTSGVWENHRVDPATVGQFTGLTDKNGKRIFERDVVRFGDRVGYVTYGDGCFCIHDAKGMNCPAIDIVMCEFDVEVIGNIHDNPELLNGGDAG